MQVFVKTLIGKTITLQVEPSDTVLKLKQLVQEKEDLTPAQQRLLFERHQLQDDRKLSYYNIRNLCTIHLVMRVLGGVLQMTV